MLRLHPKCGPLALDRSGGPPSRLPQKGALPWLRMSQAPPSPACPHSPWSPQVTARVPGGRGWGRTQALIVILHLQADGPAQTPGDVQQPLHDELIFFLSTEQATGLMSPGHRPRIASPIPRLQDTGAWELAMRGVSQAPAQHKGRRQFLYAHANSRNMPHYFYIFMTLQ